MPNTKYRAAGDYLFATSELPTHIFRAGDVSEILGIQRWRLEKFLTGKKYRLSPSAQIGKGQKPWRIFSHQDLYRLAIAYRMVEDGFTPKFVSMVLQEIEDHDLLDINESGEGAAPDVGLFRTNESPRVQLLGARGNGQSYYVLKLRELIRDVDARILRHRKTA